MIDALTPVSAASSFSFSILIIASREEEEEKKEEQTHDRMNLSTRAIFIPRLNSHQV